MVIRPEKWEELRRRMESLGISEEDLEERFILGSGKGGQKVNKTASCVRLRHPPSGLEVKCQQERSREMNRFFARRLLCDKLVEKEQKEKSAKQQEMEKIRQQKRRRKRRTQKKLVEEKRRLSEKKALRRPPLENDPKS